MATKKLTLEQLLVEVNAHLPDGLKLAPPVGKKALRYARSCLAYTYKDDATTGDGARVLGPLNALLDRIEELSAAPPSASTTTPPPAPPTPPTTTPPRSTQTTQTTQNTQTQTPPRPSEAGERWRQPRDDETPAERAFREALEEVERRNTAKTTPPPRQEQQPTTPADAQKTREALDVVERYFAGDAGALAHVQELRRALLASLERKRKAS